MTWANNNKLPLGKLLILVLLSQVSLAGEPSLFEDDTVLELALTGPLGSLFESDDPRQELPFSLRANDVEHSIKVRVRGKSRRRVCDFPPLRLNFASEKKEQTVIAGQNKLKLVTHCRRYPAAQTDTLQEYAAYRIFNLLSDHSYRVRLLHITYTDTEGQLRESVFNRYGFLIESSSELADRLGAQPLHIPGVSLRTLNSRQAATVYIFQYLIGNTDWSLVNAEEEETCCHNGDLFDAGSDRYYVPYDFDLSGLVNPRYAKPDAALRISRVTQRLYRGYCISSDALRGALNDIKAREAEILDVIRQLPVLPAKDTKATLKFIEKFFAQASDEDKLIQSFERRCLQ